MHYNWKWLTLTFWLSPFLSVAVLLHKPSLFTPNPFFFQPSLSQLFVAVSKSNTTVCNTSFILVCVSFFAYNFSPVPAVFHQFFISIAQGNVDLHFKTAAVTKASAVGEETK
jgi:hypothetical protein